MKSLAKDGIGIGSSTLAANRLGQLDKAGLAFAYDLSLLTAPIAALLALGLLIFLLVSDGPRRRQEMLILTTSGMPKRLVRRSLLIESGLVLAVALILGALIGVGADALALASLPQFAQGTGGLPIGNGVPIGPDIWAATALAVVLVVSTLVVNGFTIRSVGPTDGGSQ
jgi:ABC-type lipoprotein release transport system permease subunit